MSKKLLIGPELLDIIVKRLVQQLIENHDDFSDSVIVGMQPRGIFLADKIAENLEEALGQKVPVGYLDVTFYRDDFRRRETPLKASSNKIPFLVENKKVILVDDVLYTGRTIRAALDALTAYGRPDTVELLTLIDRKYSRDLPIEARYVGRHVNSLHSQKVVVEWQAQGAEANRVWLTTHKENEHAASA